MTCKHTLLCKIHLHLKVKKQWNDVMCYLTFHEFSMCQRFEWSPKTSSINILICSIIWFTHLWLGIVLPAQYVIFGMNMILTVIIRRKEEHWTWMQNRWSEWNDTFWVQLTFSLQSFRSNTCHWSDHQEEYKKRAVAQKYLQ